MVDILVRLETPIVKIVLFHENALIFKMLSMEN